MLLTQYGKKGAWVEVICGDYITDPISFSLQILEMNNFFQRWEEMNKSWAEGRTQISCAEICRNVDKEPLWLLSTWF